MPEFDLFISYSRADQDVVVPLAHKLRTAGLSVYLDRWYAVPGMPWMLALESTLDKCQAVAVFIGSELGQWQQREKEAALQRQSRARAAGVVFPVIPVLLRRDAAPLGFLDQNTWIALADSGEDEALAILVKAAHGEPPGPGVLDSTAAAKAVVCPYRGLLYFREEDAPLFYGRAAAIASLLEVVEQKSLVAVVGDSGSGKSSVVRAGLLPALRSSRDQAWEMLTMVPGDRPFHRLAAALMQVLQPDLNEVERLIQVPELASALETGKSRLRDAVDQVLQRQTGTQRLLLVVDQWEELFTMTASEAQRLGFIEHLLEATAKSALTVVLTLRGDYFGRAVSSHRQLADRLQNAQVNLGPMTRDELHDAIVKPAQQVKLEFEANLADLILEHAAAEPGNLPLLEFALRELWVRRQGDRRLHRKAYDEIGQLKGAIAKRADTAYQRLTRGDASAVPRLRSIFVRLVRPGEGQADTRQRVPLAEFDEPSRQLVEQLAGERLLVTAGLGAGGSTGDGATVEVAHEALIVNWSLLQQWVGSDRDFMVWRTGLDDQLNGWERAGRKAGALPGGIALAQARDWLKKRRADLSARETAFITAAARRRAVFVYGLCSIAAFATIAVLFFAASAERERARAAAARARAETLIEYMVFELRDRLAPVGRLELMAGVNERVNEYYEQLGDEGSADIQRRRASAFSNQGDTHLEQGRLDAARKAYEQSLAIRERLAKADATNTGWQRDLSVSYIKLGELSAVAGRSTDALALFGKGLDISERLAKFDPANAVWKGDLDYVRQRRAELQAKRPAR